MCHWNTVNWNCIIRKETLEEKLSEEEKHALSRLQKELSEQKKVELLFTDADLEKDITFFLSRHHVKPEECMLLATDPEEVAWAKKDADSDSDQLTIIGYEVPDFSKQMPLSNVDMLLLGLEEVDTEFLLRTFQRKHHLPWRILETKRCYLREITLDDMDDLFDLYNKKGITDYIEPLYERQEEEEYQRAYIENMYGYYGYGMWLAKEKESTIACWEKKKLLRWVMSLHRNTRGRVMHMRSVRQSWRGQKAILIFEELTVWWSRGMKHRWDCFINLAFRKQRR